MKLFFNYLKTRLLFAKVFLIIFLGSEIIMKLLLKICPLLKWITQIAPIVVEIKTVFSLKTAFIAAKAGKWTTENARTTRSLIETDDFGW